MDVAIIGGGPAGTAAALTLRRHRPDLRIVLVDPDDVEIRAGETLPPSVLSLFDYLELRQRFLEQGWLPSDGMESSWGFRSAVRRETLFSGRGPGWHIDRHRFDRWLRAAAVEAGTEWRRSRLLGAERTSAGWRLRCQDGSAECRIAIDATGRAARFARLAGARRVSLDSLMGTLWWFQGPPRTRAEGTLVETTPEGWWYSAHLPEGRLVAGFLTDADLLPTWLRERDLATGLAGAPQTAQRLDGTRLVAGPITRSASTTCSEPTADVGWVAAGDAALAFDPLASLGISHAILSGIEAARAVAVAAEGAVAIYPAFAETSRQLFADFRRRQLSLYRAERRWPTATFWARRHAESNHVSSAEGISTFSPAVGAPADSQPARAVAPVPPPACCNAS